MKVKANKMYLSMYLSFSRSLTRYERDGLKGSLTFCQNFRRDVMPIKFEEAGAKHARLIAFATSSAHIGNAFLQPS